MVRFGISFALDPSFCDRKSKVKTATPLRYCWLNGTALTATTGTVTASGPAGVGRSDTVTYSPKGFNHVYGTWDVTASSNSASLKFVVPAGESLLQPVLVVHSYTGSLSPTILLNGSTIDPGDGFYVSNRSDKQELWLTINRTLSGTATLQIN